MSESASRVRREIQLLTITSSGKDGILRREILSIFFLVIVFVVLAIQNDVSIWGDASVGSLYRDAITIVSIEMDIVAKTASGGLLPIALNAVRDEKDHIETEQEMFQEFAEKIQSLSTTNQSIMGVKTQTVNISSGNCVLMQVRDTYRETVMSTPNFDCEYGESFHEHVAAEFGDGAASLLINGHHLSEPGKRFLVQQASQSARKRGHLLGGHTIEERSLQEAKSVLKPVQKFLTDIEQTDLFDLSLSRLISLDTELRTYRECCETLINERQQAMNVVNRRIEADSKTIAQEYLYRNLSVNFPVLSVTLDCISTLENIRSMIIQAVCQPR
ncbi:DUF7260 family protein [Natronosalvus rutilus]|uniref:DUF7260 domain-containing protein n=1 Tax=Natronosalvus rutilus TaxID=2953753 RepID=A0A9E7SWQ8_9EURY|nr:hypothetical protein [Natronosalvus rutilus]UTF55720.1 hypothetical protein NGM29_18680 [Natronosalvus rutilus]